MAEPLAADVLAFLGQDEAAPTAQIEAHLPIVTAMVKAYTRGRGFDTSGDPDEALAAVIIASTARLVSNPTMTTFTALDDAQVRQGTFNGWTLPELAILHAYRRRAQ